MPAALQQECNDYSLLVRFEADLLLAERLGISSSSDASPSSTSESLRSASDWDERALREVRPLVLLGELRGGGCLFRFRPKKQTI